MMTPGMRGGRTKPRQPNLGMPFRPPGGGGVDPGFNVGPQQGGLPPDRNGAQRGLGYGMGLAQGMGGKFAGPSPGAQGGGMGGQPSWAQRGFESRDAAQSVQRQYGQVQQPGGGWGKPDMDFLTRQMEANGWGPQFQAQSTNEQGTPVNIGGARWFSGKNGVQYSGQQSDLAGGQAYDSAQQTPYGQQRPRRTRTFGQVAY